MFRKVLATFVVASIATLSIAMPKHEGNELSVRQNHGDYYDIWGQAAPPAEKAAPQGEVPRCSCPNGQAGILTSGKCACAPLPAGPAAHVPLSKKNEEIDDTAAKDTEDLDRQSDLEERAVNCAFKITCPYMQHAVRQNGVCTCVPQRTKEKRDTAESTLPDEQPRRPAAPCAFEINCPYMQHAVRQNGACTCIPVRSKEKRSIVESSLHEKSYRHQAPNPCAATRCPKHFFATQFDNKCTCAPLTFKDKRRSAALDDLDHKDQASG